jgi:2-polyprenyl-3-methyl-5-hydroxy-6-metoxy-1,4-benzoquinol methylase
MQRTIEKLAQDRRAAEVQLHDTLAELRRLIDSFERPASLPSTQPPPARGGLFHRRPAPAAEIPAGSKGDMKNLGQAVARLAETLDVLSDVRDKLWDAEGNNHVGMIFKSMEWRVDRLAAAYEDASTLMRTFAHLKEQIGRLLADIEGRKLPSPAQIEEVLRPIEDWRYLRFENRFRGAEEQIRAHQAGFLADFPPGSRILDVGCGRGEFLELLGRGGFRAEGIDLNAEMIEVCRNKGLSVERGDLLENLAARPDGSLDGIFSSQVIEHLEPAALRRMVELAYAKLRPDGRLLLETVNPTSVSALVRIYFLDSTHRTPVHPQTLQFLLEASGFISVAVRFGKEPEEERLQAVPPTDETAVILNRNWDRLNALLYGPAEYAVIGRKP